MNSCSMDNYILEQNKYASYNFDLINDPKINDNLIGSRANIESKLSGRCTGENKMDMNNFKYHVNFNQEPNSSKLEINFNREKENSRFNDLIYPSSCLYNGIDYTDQTNNNRFGINTKLEAKKQIEEGIKKYKQLNKKKSI